MQEGKSYQHKFNISTKYSTIRAQNECFWGLGQTLESTINFFLWIMENEAKIIDKRQGKGYNMGSWQEVFLSAESGVFVAKTRICAISSIG